MKNPLKKMIADMRTSTTPVTFPRTHRVHSLRGITSLPPGKMVPLSYMPVLQEDQIVSGRLRYNFEMMETADTLLNPVNVRLFAYFVPWLALARFNGSMDMLARSQQGAAFPGLAAVPYIETERFDAGADVVGAVNNAPGKSNPIYRYLGLHAADDAMINTGIAEAYNLIWNLRAINRSKNIPLRARLDKTLAPAFWYHDQHRHILADFDQAKIDGQVALNVVNGAKMPVKGIGIYASNALQAGVSGSLRTSDSAATTYAANGWRGLAALGQIAFKDNGAGFLDVYAEMQANGITVSLSNIELARKTQAFADLRAQYSGHSEDWIINRLMSGLQIPDKAFDQPMLIGEKSTSFGLSKRYATDGANLSKSVANGATFIDLSINLPKMPMMGVVMVVAEITPDQLFERQRDPFLHAQTADEFPDALRDTLDPEKVMAVPNNYIDVDHATPNATFGYAPNNYMWHSQRPNIGGKYYRPDVAGGFSEVRQKLWAVETVNPTLAADWYLCTNMHQQPFAQTIQDNFECIIEGDVLIEGLTQFGGLLKEASDDYAKVLAEAPQTRITKP